MKIFLILALVLCIVGSPFAQTLRLEPLVTNLHLEGSCNQKVSDTLYVRNIAPTSRTITVTLKEHNSGWRNNQQEFTLAPNVLGSVPVTYYKYGGSEAGSYRDTITISDGTSTLLIPAEALMKAYAISASSQQIVKLRNIKVGDSACGTYWGRNRTQKPITLYEVTIDPHQTDLFSVNPKVPLPYVLLPGEDLPLFDVCHTPTVPNQKVYTDININASDYDDQKPYLHFEVYSVVDSILLKPCLELNFDKDYIGPVLIGGDREAVVHVQSNRYTDQVVDDFSFIEGDVSSFTVINTTFPVTIAALEKKPFTIRFSPRDVSPVVKYRYATKVKTLGPSCTSTAIDLVGLAILPTADSIATPLLPDKDYVLGMSGTSPSFTKDFHFVNNSTGNVKVVSVGFASPSTEFSIANITPTNVLPFTLLPSEKMTVTVQFTPSKPNKIFSNHLVITTENGIQSASFEIQAMQTSTASVATRLTQPTMTVSPNPARREVNVTFEDAVTEKIEVFDLLGNSVKTFGFSHNSWSWIFADDHIAKGSYFIRAEGRSNDGQPFRATKYLIVE